MRSRKNPSLLAGQAWSWNAAHTATAHSPIEPAPRATPATQPAGRRVATRARTAKTSAQKRLDAPSVTIDRRERTYINGTPPRDSVCRAGNEQPWLEGDGRMDVLAERADIDATVSGKTICTIFADAARNWGDRPALRWKQNGDWEILTWKGYREQVAAVTLALRELGFGSGQFGLIMARNVPEHMIADLGIVHAGGAAISVYNTLAPEQIEYVANHSEATIAFVEDAGFLAKFLEIRPSVPSLRHIVLIHGEPPEGVMSWDSLVASGQALYARDPSAFERSWRGVGPEDTVSLIYTSGTTGPPKGVTYSHYNILWTAEASRRRLKFENDVLVSYLPLAHVSERFTSQWNGIYAGHEVYFCPDTNQLGAYLVEARPTVFVGVPRVWEKLMAGIQAAVVAEPDEAKRQMAQGALTAAQQAYRLRMDGKEVPAELAAGVDKAQPLFGMLLAKIGLDRCR